MRARWGEWCRRLQWASWQFGNIVVDCDGEISGSGFLVRLEPPRWVRAWARRFIPPPTEEEMRLHRIDVSDILLTSLVPGVMPMGEYLALQHATPPTLVWAEDQLNATDG